MSKEITPQDKLERSIASTEKHIAALKNQKNPKSVPLQTTPDMKEKDLDKLEIYSLEQAKAMSRVREAAQLDSQLRRLLEIRAFMPGEALMSTLTNMDTFHEVRKDGVLAHWERSQGYPRIRTMASGAAGKGQGDRLAIAQELLDKTPAPLAIKAAVSHVISRSKENISDLMHNGGVVTSGGHIIQDTSGLVIVKERQRANVKGGRVICLRPESVDFQDERLREFVGQDTLTFVPAKFAMDHVNSDDALYLFRTAYLVPSQFQEGLAQHVKNIYGETGVEGFAGFLPPVISPETIVFSLTDAVAKEVAATQ